MRRHGRWCWRVCRRARETPRCRERCFRPPSLLLSRKAGSLRDWEGWARGCSGGLAGCPPGTYRGLPPGAHEARAPESAPGEWPTPRWRTPRLCSTRIGPCCREVSWSLILCYLQGPHPRRGGRPPRTVSPGGGQETHWSAGPRFLRARLAAHHTPQRRQDGEKERLRYARRARRNSRPRSRRFLDPRQGQSEAVCRLVAGEALQVAENQDRTILLGHRANSSSTEPGRPPTRGRHFSGGRLGARASWAARRQAAVRPAGQRRPPRTTTSPPLPNRARSRPCD